MFWVSLHNHPHWCLIPRWGPEIRWLRMDTEECVYRSSLAPCNCNKIWLHVSSFLLLLFIKTTLSTHNGLPRGTLPLCLNVKPNYICSGIELTVCTLLTTSPYSPILQPMATTIFFFFFGWLFHIYFAYVKCVYSWIQLDLNLFLTWLKSTNYNTAIYNHFSICFYELAFFFFLRFHM